MATWKLQDAKARLSEVIQTASLHGPQVITQRGVETAVVVPIDEWRRTKKPKTKLEALLGGPKFEIPLPRRGQRKRRKPVSF